VILGAGCFPKEKEDKPLEKEEPKPTRENPFFTGDLCEDPPEILLARTIYGEARDRRLSDKARTAVAYSIKNRLGTEGKYGEKRDTLHKVILEDRQYSIFNPKNSNYDYVLDPLHKIRKLDENSDKYKLEKNTWLNCCDIAEKVLKREVPDPTDGATHYYDDSIEKPYWATEENFKVKIDTLNFYKLT
jgi:hypothetical protein